MAGALAPAIVRAQSQQPEQRGLGIRLTEVPTDRADDPRANRYIIDHVEPGESISRRIEVSNTTGEAKTVRVYVGAAEIRQARFVPAEEEDEGDIVEWSSVSTHTLDLADGERSLVTVTIDVPEGASGGERYGVVWAELPGVPTESGATVVNRVGVRIYLSVGGEEEPPSDFEISTLTARRTEEGVPQILAQVTNTGQRALDMSGELELTEGPGGLRAGPFPAQLGTTLGIGDTADITIDLDPEIPSGPWVATLTLQSGRLEKTSEATITFPDEAGETAAPVEAVPREVTGTVRGRAALASALVLLLIALGLLLFFFLRRRRRDEDEEHEHVRA